MRALLLSLYATLLIACGPSLRVRAPMAVEAAEHELSGASMRARADADSVARARALDATTTAFAEALAQVDPTSAETIRASFLRAAHEGDAPRADSLLQLWQPEEHDAKAVFAFAELAIGVGNLESARQSAWDGARRFEESRPGFMRLWYRAHVADEAFFSKTVHTVVPGEDLDALERLGGGSTITLKFRMNDETTGAFKPYQTRMQSYYRAEIAAYRLCPLIHCGFSIPENREVRIREQDFLDLYGLRSIERARGYGAGFVDLIWFEDEDGERWIHGTLKEWVPGFTSFPIEYASAWEPLLDRNITRSALEQMSLEEALRPLRAEEQGNYSSIMSRADDLTAVELARQISNIHVFDYLLANWDRYSGEFFGVNCQFNNGEFVSIDNGAALQPANIGGDGRAPFERLQRVKRFSRSTVDAIRWMDLEMMQTIFFPLTEDPLNDELERFKLFAVRRIRFLEYVDELIADYGEDAVFIFD